MMKNSKSVGNKENEAQDKNIVVDNQAIVTIIDTNIEREIQNVLLTNEFDQNQPCCSWNFPGQSSAQPEGKANLVVTEDNSKSSISVSVDVNCSPYQEISRFRNDNNQATGSAIYKDTDKGNVVTENGSLTNLFDGIEVFEPMNITLPPAASQQHSRYPNGPVTNQPSPQTPLTMNQPHAQPPKPPVTNRSPPSRYAEVPPTTSRGIHLINIPNDSINRSLQITNNVPNNRVAQRGDQALGPPPSYSKSLLDRRINPCASIQFVAPIPPPSYDGMESELRYAHTLGHSGGFTLGLGNTWQGQPQPAYCPVCETVIISQVDIRISRIAHIAATVMFFLLCWPFCLLPYFLNICNYTFHYCSVCQSYLGARRPFQRG